MVTHSRGTPTRVLMVVLAAAAASGGCVGSRHAVRPAPDPIPRELNKVTMPEYVIEPPDILQIDALSLIPLPPYRVKPLDELAIRVPGALMDAPISGLYPIDPDGTVNFGAPYGAVSVAGMTLDEARVAIEKHLEKSLKKENTTAEVSLSQSRGVQAVRGPHLVRQDGTVGLGQYGSVQVTGLTLAQAKAKIEAHLSRFLKDPEITVDVQAFNSKVYYVIIDNGGFGQQVNRQPIYGNETVLDAIGGTGGLGVVSDTRRIWVSRPGPNGCETILPVDWNHITMNGGTGTNYQLMPGDRVFVQSYQMSRFEAAVNRVINPVERLIGFSLLGYGAVQTFRNAPGSGGGFFGGGSTNNNVIVNTPPTITP